MQNEPRPDPFFVADHVALDFINSVAKPRSTEFDWLSSGPDLINWLVLAGLLSDGERALLEQSCTPQELDQAAAEIRMLREECRAFVVAAAGAPERVGADPFIDRLNAILALGRYDLALERGDNTALPPSLSYRQHITTARDLLPRVAKACAQLISEADFTRLHNCQGPTCSLYFLDTSKNHRRRWCTMEVCGNRAKAAAHREKVKKTAATKQTKPRA